jgi:anti-sigma regulatory factor (Ser/Thr protein kinase)
VLPGLRRTLQRWLAAQDVSAEEAYDVVFASHEAAANIVEHAYGLERGQIELRCRADEDAVHVTLADRGRWRLPRGEGRGLGVGLMREVMDEVEIERFDGGSTVHLLRRRSRGSA